MTPRGDAARVVGVDLARGVAVLGMFVAHAAPVDGEMLADGRSSILFGTLAGVSLGLITGGPRPAPRGARAARVTSIAMRALVLFVLGVALTSLNSGIAIILDYYGLMFLALLPALFLPRAVLAAIAAVLAVVAPIVAARTPSLDGAPPGSVSFGDLAGYYLLTGYYPVLVWLPFLLVGLIAARSDLTRVSTQLAMIGGGASASLVGYGAAALMPGVSAEAHSGTTAEVLGSGGLAIAVIGVLCLATAPGRGRAGAVLPAVLSPITATGSMALTVYTAQIVALAIAARIRDSTGAVEYPGWPLLIGLCVGALVFATIWRRVAGRGPLERAMGLLTNSDRARTPVAP